MSLGSDLAVTAGPWGAGGALDWGVPQNEKGKNLAPPEQQSQVVEPAPTGFSAPPTVEQGSSKNRKPSPFREAIKKPVYSYVKSRGFYAGVQVDGTVVTERKDANAAFYGQAVTVDRILKGEVPAQGPNGVWPAAAGGLFEVLKGAEGWRGQPGQGPGGVVSGAGVQGSGAVAPGQGSSATYPIAQASAFTAPVAPVQQHNVPDVTAGVQGMNLGANSAVPPPPAAAYSKEAEAAAEREAAAHHGESSSGHPPPPAYAEPTGHAGEDAPPAYVEDGQYRPPVGDSKTGLH